MTDNAMMVADRFGDFASCTRSHGIRKVLILADDSSRLDALRELCLEQGCGVCLCHRAEEVSSLCVKCDPDLVILDHSGMDIAIVSKVRSLRINLSTHVPILVFFSHLSDLASDFYSPSDVTFYLLRPRRADAFKHLLCQALSVRQSA